MNQIANSNTSMNEFSISTLEDDEICVISGGNPFFIAMAGFGATLAALNAAEQFGEKLGKAAYYALH
ncbi:hypothetical protein [Massilia putida]|uniref:hypothetical protein n=1 Tax=Massilia putida TaxID=1141883 RepID=UPI0012EB554C|nr:hypothetical protein [Massilia putida]